MSMTGIGLLGRSALALFAGLGFAAPATAATGTPIDANLYSTYRMNGTSQITIETCGATTNVQGCFPEIALNNLVNPCAVLEGPSTTTGNTVTRDIYVLETGTDAKPIVTLKVFRKNLIITPNYVTPALRMLRSVPIRSLIGGSGLSCYMAANSHAIFLGTSNATHAVELNKTNFIGHPFGSSPNKLIGITANEAGFVTVSFGSKANTSFDVFGPDGKDVGFGGGGPFFLPNQLNALPPR
jgi:hypothetical protein